MLFAAVSVVAVISAIVYLLNRPLTVTIRNTGKDQLDSVVVSYSGGSFKIGDMRSRERVTITVHPTAESNISIEFRNFSGRELRHDVDCRVGPALSGNVSIVITGTSVETVEQNTYPKL